MLAMRKLMIAGGSVVLGVLLGGAGAGIMTARHYNQMFQNWYVVKAIEQTHIVRRIRSGEGDALAARIENSLPQYVLALDQGFGRNEVTLPALWCIKDFYATTATPVPEQIQSNLSNLPPQLAEGCIAPNLNFP